MRQLIICVIMCVAGAFLGFILSPMFEIAKNVEKTVVMVDPDWLEHKLFPHAIKETYQKKPGALLNSLLETIDFTITDDTHHLLGYQFYLGYAKMRWKDGVCDGLDVYSVYDTALYDALIPTYQINFYQGDGFSLVYSGMEDVLYIATFNGDFRELQKGGIDVADFSGFIEKEIMTGSE